MNDYHLWTLAHEIGAERREEAARHRLARSARIATITRRPSSRSPRTLWSRATLGSLLHRVAVL